MLKSASYIKPLVLVILFFHFSLIGFSQNENPSKLLSFDNQESVDQYLIERDWSFVKKHGDDLEDGKYLLYRKKSMGGGWAYLSLHLEKFIHYQVFFFDKKDYSLVLSYEDLINIPEGKSKYNLAHENADLAIKSVSFDDPHETRNKNVFYGHVPLSETANQTEGLKEFSDNEIDQHH